MHGMQLSAVDTNLVVPLHALLEERSVVAAAKRVGLSPSATSHALARLRQVLGDPLLVRAGRKLVLTPRAEALLETTRQCVDNLERVFHAGSTLEPKKLKRAFRLATTDHVQLSLLRAVDRILVREAPGVDLYCLPMDRGSYAALRQGDVDFSVGVFGDPPPDIGRSPLFVDQLVSVVRRGHPLLRGKLELELFVAHPHALVAPIGSPTGLLDEILARRGLSRRVARTLPTFVDAALLASETDYVLTLPRTVVQTFQRRFGLKVLTVPLALPSFTISLAWHRRHHAQPEHQWLQGVIARAVRSGGQGLKSATAPA